MNLPLTYYVIFTYKNAEYSHQFTANRPLTKEMIEQEIEGYVSSRFGRSYDPSKIFVRSYRYGESE
jgi:hypothetical protein